MGAVPAARFGEGERLSRSQTCVCVEGAACTQAGLSQEHGAGVNHSVPRSLCSEQDHGALRGGSWLAVGKDLCNSLLFLT